MASIIELISRSTKNGTAITKQFKPGEAGKAEAGSVYDLRVDGQPVPKGTKLTRKGSKLQFTFPDGSTFEINEWCGVSDSKFADLTGTMGYDEVGRKFVDVQEVESGECKMTTSSGESIGSMGAPSTMNLGAILGGVAMAGLAGGASGAAAAAVVVAQPGTPSGQLASGSASSTDKNVSASNLPSLTGKSAPGDKISVKLPSGEVLNTIADAQGNWTVTLVNALPDGVANILVTATSKDGVVGTPVALSIVIDTTAPTAPTISAINESSDGHITGSEAANGTQVQLALAGTGSRAGDTLQLRWGSEVINHVLTQAEIDAGSVVVDVPAEVITAVGNGQVPVTVSVTDSVGNIGTAGSATNALVAMGMPSAAPQLTTASDSGPSATDHITSERQPVLSIETPPTGYTPVLLVNGVRVASNLVTIDGVTTLQPVTPLSEGDHVIAIAYVDEAGVQSPSSPGIQVIVDTTAPAVAASAPGLSPASDTGSSNEDSITGDSTPSFQVNSPSTGETPNLYVDGARVPSTYDPITGTLTPVTALPAGVHSIAVSTSDAAGNESPVSTSQTVTIVTPPAAPTTSLGIDAPSDTGASDSDSNTSNNNPVLTIPAPGTGLTPTLYVDGVAVAATWDDVTNTLTPLAPLSEGPHSLTYTLTDVNGIEGNASPELSVIIDSTAPDAPSAAIDLTTATDLGASSTDNLTMNTMPSFTVPVIAPGETASLYIDGMLVPATYNAATSTLTPTVAISDGPHLVASTVTDAAGNESALSPSITVTIDATASAAPASAPDLILSSDSGTSGTDNLTSNGTPTFVVPAPAPGETVTLYVDGVAVDALWDAVANSLTPIGALSDGVHAITSTVTDAAGNESVPGASLSVTIDSSAPVAPIAPDLSSASDTGGNTDDSTSIDTPSFIVPTLASGESASLYVDGVLVDATWDAIAHSLTPTVALSEGPHSITTTITDAAGNEGTPSAALLMTVDQTAPTTPSATPDLASSSDTGTDTADNITGDTTPTIVVPVLGAGEIATLYVDGIAVAATWDAVNHSLTPNSPLSVGLHDLSFTITDAAGNESAESPVLGIEILAAPAAPSTLVDLQLGSDSGASPTDNITSETSPVFAIAAPPSGLTPRLYIDGIASAAVFDSLTNTFSLPASMAEGTYLLSYTLTNIAGAESGASPALSLVIDSSAPAAPSAAPDMTSATDQGSSSVDDLTMDSTPTFTLPSLSAGEIATLYVDGIAVAAIWDAVNNTLTPTSALSDGVHSITSTITDASGNEGAAGAALSIEIETVAPVAPASAPDMVAGTDSGSNDADNRTNVDTPSFTVPAPGPGESATLYVDGVAVASVWDSVNNTLTPVIALGDGPHSITTTVTDEAGNESPASSALSIDIDTTASAVPGAPNMSDASDTGTGNTDDLTSNNTPAFSVAAPAVGESVNLFVDGILVAAAWDSVNNRLTPIVALSDGTHLITTSITDAAGNETAQGAALSIEIDSAAPTAPASAPDLTDATDSGSSNSDNLTRNPTPTFTVPALAPGESARLYVDGVAVAAAWDAVNHTLTPTLALGGGSYTITSTIIDAAGNESLPGAALAITIDVAASAAPAAALFSLSDSGTIGDGRTSDQTPTISGTGVFGETITVVFPATGESISTPVAPDGSWSVTASSNIAHGTVGNAIVTTTDAAGNESTPTNVALTIDTAAPTLSSASPADNATGVMPSAAITLNYNEAVTLGSGHQTITLYNFDTGVAVETFNVTTGIGSNGGTLSASGSSVSLNLGSTTQPGTHYDLQMQAGAVTDIAGNDGAAISSNTALDFTTLAPAATVSVTNLASTTYSAYLHSINPNLANSNTMMYKAGTTNFGSTIAGFTGTDDTSAYMDITPAFASGLNWFGTTYNQIGVGTNGYMTFGHLNNGYNPAGITGYTTGGMIAAQFDDWYSRYTAVTTTPGGNSQGTNDTYFAAYQNAGYGVVTLTFDDVSSYPPQAAPMGDGLTTSDFSKGNAEQIRLVSTNTGETIIQIVYESVNWMGVWGTAPSAGWTKGDGATYGVVDGNIPGTSSGGISGTNNILDVELASNVGIAGVFEWVIGSDGMVSAGTVPMINTHATGAAQDAAQLSAAGGTVTYAQDPGLWDSRFSLIGNKIQANAGAVFLPTETDIDLWVQVHDDTSGITYPKLVNVQLFDQMGGAGSDQIGLRAASDISKLTAAVASQVVMNGNAGEDSLVFTGTGLNLDLTAVQDSALINVEKVDLGSGNSLTLALADVFSLSSADQFNSGNGWVGLPATVTLEQLVIDGNGTDSVTVMNSGAFSNQWNTTSAGTADYGGHTYAIYNSLANTGQLLIDQNVNLVFG